MIDIVWNRRGRQAGRGIAGLGRLAADASGRRCVCTLDYLVIYMFSLSLSLSLYLSLSLSIYIYMGYWFKAGAGTAGRPAAAGMVLSFVGDFIRCGRCSSTLCALPARSLTFMRFPDAS